MLYNSFFIRILCVYWERKVYWFLLRSLRFFLLISRKRKLKGYLQSIYLIQGYVGDRFIRRRVYELQTYDTYTDYASNRSQTTWNKSLIMQNRIIDITIEFFDAISVRFISLFYYIYLIIQKINMFATLADVIDWYYVKIRVPVLYHKNIVIFIILHIILILIRRSHF